MSELIVLGLVPGTRIQITFAFWLLVIVIAVVSLFARLHRRGMLRGWIVAVRLRLLMRQRIEY